MDSPSVKRPFSSPNGQANVAVKKKCTTPSIMNYFSPRPKVTDSPKTTTAATASETGNQNITTPVKSVRSNTPSFVTANSVESPQASSKQQTTFGTPKTPQVTRVLSSNAPSPSSPSVKDNVSTANSNSSEELNHPHLKYSFLYPPKRRDFDKRAPDHPDYDEKTLHVPEEFLNKQTPALRQWWEIKRKNMDAILFFKMGKFYELFNEDAVIGVNNLDIIYMKGDEDRPAHAGFPEVSFKKYANILINKGFKVMRIEQTETPAMMEERIQATGKRGKFDKVVKREVCQITTKGTQMMGISDTVFHSAQNQYLLALYESVTSDSGSQKKVFGVCFIDVTVSKLYIGQFTDDNNLSHLNILLAHYAPTEVLYERNNLSQQAYQTILKTGASLTCLRPDKEFWSIKKAISHVVLNKIFHDEDGILEWPVLLKSLFEEGDNSDNLLPLEPRDDYKHGLYCFGAIVYYLNSQMIENQVLRCSKFDLYVSPLERNNENLPVGSDGPRVQIPNMIMDDIALRNLEIFTDSSGGFSATLFDSINHCKTHFGQRLLKSWVCSPLCDVEQIENRLDAVEALVSNRNASLMNEISHVLNQTPDLERLLTKIKSQCFKSEGDARAIMFDGNQHSKAKITSFLNLLTNFKRLQKFIKSVSNSIDDCGSKVLKRLLSFTTDNGLYPDYSATLDYFDRAFDHKAAQQTGKIDPTEGVVLEYDECKEDIERMKLKLEEYLDEQMIRLNCRKLEYFGNAKNRYQIQIPEAYCDNLPPEYRIETNRKGFKRYYTPAIDKYFAKLTTLEEKLKKILDNVMSSIFEQFMRKSKLWSAAIECVALLDVLQSIASFVRSLKASNFDVCRPEFVQNGELFIEYTDGRHPALIRINSNYIPNDLKLDEKLILLSGANMGGKSTLMRQTALIVILAQIGCLVPASKLRLTPVDRIFCRLGASDRLLEGESTFYTELVETSAMLRCATERSLLLLDELGRGTSTYDGTAIAYSVMQEISKNMKCRCIFSTHYHTLVRDFEASKEVRLAHMACEVETDGIDNDPLRENLNFLYKIADGPAVRSYGFNVAKLAGIDGDIIKDAFNKAKEIELSCKVLGAVQEICRAKGNSNGKVKDELKSKVLGLLAAKG